MKREKNLAYTCSHLLGTTLLNNACQYCPNSLAQDPAILTSRFCQKRIFCMAESASGLDEKSCVLIDGPRDLARLRFPLLLIVPARKRLFLAI